MPVLITAGLSPEAYRLQRILGADEVVFADESQLPQIPGRQGIVLPAHHSPSFVHETLKACLDHAVTILYPLKLGEIMELSAARALFSEYHVGLIIPSEHWLQNNLVKAGVNHAYISVLENGKLKAGVLPPDDSAGAGQTGIFSWAVSGSELEFNLYLTDDAGI